MPIAQDGFDNRKFSNEDPIARGSALTFAIVSDTTKTLPLNINGQLLGYIYTCPNLTTDTTFTIEYLDLYKQSTGIINIGFKGTIELDEFQYYFFLDSINELITS